MKKILASIMLLALLVVSAFSFTACTARVNGKAYKYEGATMTFATELNEDGTAKNTVDYSLKDLVRIGAIMEIKSINFENAEKVTLTAEEEEQVAKSVKLINQMIASVTGTYTFKGYGKMVYRVDKIDEATNEGTHQFINGTYAQKGDKLTYWVAEDETSNSVNNANTKYESSNLTETKFTIKGDTLVASEGADNIGSVIKLFDKTAITTFDQLLEYAATMTFTYKLVK